MRGRKWRRDAHSKHRPQRLQLTSMMDILTVLLLFLLKSFVVDAEVVTPAPGVELPTSSADSNPESSLVIAVSGESILFANEPIASVADVLAQDDLLIRALDQKLDTAYKQMEELAQRRGKEAPEGKILIQGDRAIEFQLLQRVMYTCNFSGFDQVALAVVSEG
ncbi:MAG: biopolymer transporter ExbD [bacterium]